MSFYLNPDCCCIDRPQGTCADPVLGIIQATLAPLIASGYAEVAMSPDAWGGTAVRVITYGSVLPPVGTSLPTLGGTGPKAIGGPWWQFQKVNPPFPDVYVNPDEYLPGIADGTATVAETYDIANMTAEGYWTGGLATYAWTPFQSFANGFIYLHMECGEGQSTGKPYLLVMATINLQASAPARQIAGPTFAWFGAFTETSLNAVRVNIYQDPPEGFTPPLLFPMASWSRTIATQPDNYYLPEQNALGLPLFSNTEPTAIDLGLHGIDMKVFADSEELFDEPILFVNNPIYGIFQQGLYSSYVGGRSSWNITLTRRSLNGLIDQNIAGQRNDYSMFGTAERRAPEAQGFGWRFADVFIEPPVTPICVVRFGDNE